MYQAPYEQGLLSNEVDTLAHFLKEAYNQPGNKQVTEISFEASKWTNNSRRKETTQLVWESEEAVLEKRGTDNLSEEGLFEHDSEVWEGADIWGDGGRTLWNGLEVKRAWEYSKNKSVWILNREQRMGWNGGGDREIDKS